MTKEQAEAEAAKLNAAGEKFRNCETRWFAGRVKAYGDEWGVWYERKIAEDHPDHNNPFWGVA